MTVKTGTVTVLIEGVTAVTTDGPPKAAEGPVGFPEMVMVKTEAEDVKGEEMTVTIAGVPMLEKAVDNVVQDVSIDPAEPKEPASESVTVTTRGVAVEKSCASVTVTMPWSVAVLVQVVSTETCCASLNGCQRRKLQHQVQTKLTCAEQRRRTPSRHSLQGLPMKRRDASAGWETWIAMTGLRRNGQVRNDEDYRRR